VDSFRPGRRSRSIGYTLVVIACTLFASASFGSDDRQRVKRADFTTERPGTPTGVKVSISFAESGPDSAVAKIVTKLARGTDFDTSVPERCPASDDELVAQGAGACPEASKVGKGLIEVAELGTGDLTLFNGDKETIFLIEFRDSPIRTVNRETARGRTQVIEIAEGATLERVQIAIDRIQKDGEGYVETPSRCPAAGKWINAGIFTYRDGVEQRERLPTACERRSA
jgi:hypothetical protein